jgi:hypothetical protein
MRDPAQKDHRRDEMAKAAAPYVHARLAAAQIEHAEKPSEPVFREVSAVTRLTAEQLRQEIIADMEELGISLYDDDEPTGVANNPANANATPENARARPHARARGK